MGLASPTQIFNTSWTAHRLSPLHHYKDHRVLIGNQDALKTYSKRLHDVLAGDFLRSMQVTLSKSLADDALSKAGALVESRWEFISTNENRQGREDDNDDDEEDLSVEPKDCMGIFVTLDYEHITYRAALLGDPDGYVPTSTDRRRKQSTHLPLLLTRMPTALRNCFIDFISTTFDSYVANLHLPPNFLCMILETSISNLAESESSRDASNVILEQVLKETQLTLSFSQSIAPSLKSLDVNLPQRTMSSFALGLRVNDTSVFLKSLSQYLDQHLAMNVNLGDSIDISHGSKNSPHVWLSKVATGTFVLSIEGRFKLIDTSSRQESAEEQTTVQKLTRSVNDQILRSLVRRASGDDTIT